MFVSAFRYRVNSRRNTPCVHRTVTIDARFKCDNPLLALLFSLAMVGCVVPGSVERPPTMASNLPCEQVATRYEDFTKKQRVQTAYGMPLDGAPWFRSFRGWDRWPVADDPDARRQWLAATATLGNRAWTAALMNADDQAMAGTLQRQMQRCARQTLDATVDDAQWNAWTDRSAQPSAYRRWQRWLGLYPITHIGLKAGVRAWQYDYLADYGASKQHSAWQVYEASVAAPALIDRLLAEAPELPGLPRPDRALLTHWVAEHAPVFRVDVATDADRPGRPVWMEDQLAFDVARPVAHVQLLPWQDRGELVWQLIYTLWFAGRPAESGWDPYAGALDGILWRGTLDRDGKLRMRDSIHPCGCYHVLFPPDAVVAAQDIAEPAVVPEVVRTPGRVEVAVRRTDHLIVDVSPAAVAADGAQQYRLAAYTDLLSMPMAGTGQRRALFGADGLVPESRRSERWYLWPSGVRSPGTMRIWGRHAIAFVGSRHFDDPNLFADLLVDQQPEGLINAR